MQPPKRARKTATIVLLSLLLLSLPGKTLAEEETPVVKEIQVLLRDLSVSGCEFYRNGSWHDSKEAGEHLTRKLRYVQQRYQLTSTEEFIAQAATKSSLSGKPYLVRCPGEQDQPSGGWLLRRLQLLRQQSTTPEMDVR